MDLRISGKRVRITGASQGIGLGVARGFAAEGCHLILTARNGALRDAAAGELRTLAVEDLERDGRLEERAPRRRHPPHGQPLRHADGEAEEVREEVGPRAGAKEPQQRHSDAQRQPRATTRHLKRAQRAERAGGGRGGGECAATGGRPARSGDRCFF